MRARKRRRQASDGNAVHRNATTNHAELPQDDQEFQRSSSSRDVDEDGYVQVELAETREKVQCPICLGIIRNTRAVKECLHRFCQECIAKYMLLGSNACPACHEHCGSDALRADRRYDALIEAFYPDVGKSKEFAFHVTVAEDLTHDSSEKATNTNTDHVSLLHNTFVPTPVPLTEHDLNATLPSIGVNVSMSEVRLEDEAMVISTTIECAVAAEQNQSEEAVDMATGGLASQHSLVLSLPIVPEQDLRVSLSASPSLPTQVTGPVLAPEDGNRVMNEDDPATIGIQKSTPVDESETVDASTLGSNPVEMIDLAPNPLVDPMPRLPLDQQLATFWTPQSTHQIVVEAVLDPPMIHTEDINIFRTKLEKVKKILQSEDASFVNTSSESGSTSIITDKRVKAKRYEFLEFLRGGYLSIVTDPSVEEKVKTLLSELRGGNICFTRSPRFGKRCEEFFAQFLSGVDTYKQNYEKIATLALWEKRRRLSHESVERNKERVKTAYDSLRTLLDEGANLIAQEGILRSNSLKSDNGRNSMGSP